MKMTPALALAVATVTSIGLATVLPTTADAAGSITITKVYVNSPGSDTGSNSSLNAEDVKIKNTGSQAKSLTGWTLRDESSHVYTFGSHTLGAGSTVTVRSGKGTNTNGTKYWQKSWYVWNKVAVDMCSWSGSVSTYVAC